jgi:hypothetical protein
MKSLWWFGGYYWRMAGYTDVQAGRQADKQTYRQTDIPVVSKFIFNMNL